MSAQARPQDYAAAIYDLAFETWTRQLDQVQKALQEDAALRAALADLRQPAQDRLRLLDQRLGASAQAHDGLTPDVRRFLGTLLEAGQIEQLDAILVEFNRLVRRHPERKIAQVISAVPLTEAERAALHDKVTKRFGADLELQFQVDASVLGGIYLRVGDQVIDGTVAGKLAALRDHLTGQGPA